MISTEELERRCDWVMKRNERLLLEQGSIAADFYFGKGEGSLLWEFRFNYLADAFNNGRMKEAIFSIVRHSVEDAGYDCVIFASDVWFMELNDKGMAADYKHIAQLSMEEREQQGYGRKVEAIVVTGQTPQYSAVISKPYYRDVVDPGRVFKMGTEHRRCVGSIDQMRGRQKMFGDWKEPGMRAAYRFVGREIMPLLKRLGGVMEQYTTLVNIAVEEP